MRDYKVSLFKEVSAKTGSQVGEAFKVLGERLMAKSKKREVDKGKLVLGK